MKKLKIVLSLLAIVGVFVASSFVYVKNTIDLFTTKPAVYKEKVYSLKAGANTQSVIKDFTKNKLENLIINYWIKEHPELTSIKKGEYAIDGKKTVIELLQDMVEGRVIIKSYPQFAIVEGTNFKKLLNKIKSTKLKDPEFFKLIEKPQAFIKELLKDKPLLLEEFAKLDSLEGLFAPATYNLLEKRPFLGMLKQAMVHQLEYLMQEWPNRVENEFIKTPYDALILASLIESETLLDSEREQISSVFINRLKIKMRLQTDPSVMYGVDPQFQGKLTKTHLKKDSPFNTYTRDGLPPTPISMPRQSSIYAALHPANGDNLYFVAKDISPEHGHVFTKSLKEHNKAVAQYRRLVREYYAKEALKKKTEKEAKEKEANNAQKIEKEESQKNKKPEENNKKD